MNRALLILLRGGSSSGDHSGAAAAGAKRSEHLADVTARITRDGAQRAEADQYDDVRRLARRGSSRLA